jgi:histidinol-phosphate aminotransferase
MRAGVGMLPLAASRILDIAPYVPGLGAAAAAKKYGLDHVVKLASNENPLGPSPRAMEAGRQALFSASVYPVDHRLVVKERICQRHMTHGFRREQVVLGNGSSELITLLVRALVAADEAVVFAWPSFLTYRLAAQVQGCTMRPVPLKDDATFDVDALIYACASTSPAAKLVFLTNPNNPTGTYLNTDELDAFMRAIHPDVVVVLDEAYIDYAALIAPKIANGLTWVQKRPRTVVLRTFSKVFALAALRIGYAICDPDIAAILHRVREPFNVNGVAQEAAIAAMDDVDHANKSCLLNAAELKRLRAELLSLGFRVGPSAANFVLMHVPPSIGDADGIYANLLKKGVIVRPVSNYDLPSALRVTVGLPEQNDRLLECLTEMVRY